MKRYTGSAVMICGMLMLVACGEDASAPDLPTEPETAPLDSLTVRVEFEPATLLLFDDSITVTVTAENRTDAEISFNTASFGCSSHALVMVNGEELRMRENRLCIDFGGEVTYAPGETTTESWTWDGRVRFGDGYLQLPPGEYEVFGTAGYSQGSATTVRLVLDPGP